MATGNNTYSPGFTLIEILVVVVLVSILTVLGVQMVNSGSVERNLQQHGRILQASIEYYCDQATLQNIPYGVVFYKSGYQFMQSVNQQWLAVQSSIPSTHEFADGSEMSLDIEGQSIILEDEAGEVPQLLCDATGELNPFELTLTDATKKHHYQLKTIGFWQMQGQWLDESKE